MFYDNSDENTAAADKLEGWIRWLSTLPMAVWEMREGGRKMEQPDPERPERFNLLGYVVTERSDAPRIVCYVELSVVCSTPGHALMVAIQCAMFPDIGHPLATDCRGWSSGDDVPDELHNIMLSPVGRCWLEYEWGETVEIQDFGGSDESDRSVKLPHQ